MEGKKQKSQLALAFQFDKTSFNGRGEKIRTSDPLHPMQMRYQAALHPDSRET